jgi:CBS domain-containing protein
LGVGAPQPVRRWRWHALCSCSGEIGERMKKNEPVTHVMSKLPEGVQRGQRLSDARRIMTERAVHHVPVLDGKQLVGMLSITDMMRVSHDIKNAQSMDAAMDATHTLESVMTKNPVSLEVTRTIRDAVGILAEGRFHALPVVENGELRGMVTTTDLLRHMAEQY